MSVLMCACMCGYMQWPESMLGVFLESAFGVLAGKHSYSYTLDQRLILLYSGKVILFHRARSLGRDTHGVVREEGNTGLASQISYINPAINGVTDVAAISPSHPLGVFLDGSPHHLLK